MKSYSHLPVRIHGHKANLVSMLTDDEAIRLCHRWMSDEMTVAWMGQPGEVLSLSDVRARAEKMATWNPGERHFSILDAESGEYIGNCGIEIMGGSNAMLGIMICDEEHRNQGIGTEVMGLLCDFAFTEMGVHRVTLEVAAENARARRCYEKAGFVECGTEHEVAWYHGRWNDCVRMELLKSGWDNDVRHPSEDDAWK